MAGSSQDSINYYNLDITLQRAGNGYRAVLHSQSGENVTVNFTKPFSDMELENFLLRVGRSRQSVRRIDNVETAAAKDFGGKLYNTLFKGEGAGTLRRDLDYAHSQDARLRLRLSLTATPELADLPWEYLYNPTSNQFLALSVETPVVRYLELRERIPPLVVNPPLRVLMMVSSPNDYASLDADSEARNLHQALSGLEQQGLVQIDQMTDANLPALQRRLRRGEYHIFHFIGHGGFDSQTEQGVLVLEDENGRGRPVSGQDLGMLLHDHRSLRLAILNACEGGRADRTDPFAGTAQSLVQQGIPAVIAMQFEITDQAAITFAHEFYEAISDNYPVDAALTEARKTLFGMGAGLEWGTPVLYLRAPNGRIFDVQRSAVNDRTAKLAALTYEANSAMQQQQWQAAAEKWQAVLAMEPGSADAGAKLAEAQQNAQHAAESNQRGKVAQLAADANAAMQREQWQQAIEQWQAILAVEPGNIEATTKLSQSQRSRQLVGKLEEGCTHLTAGRYDQALQAFNYVRNIAGPNFKSVGDLITEARQKQTAEQEKAKQENLRAGQLALLFNQAQAAVVAEDWPKAIQRWQGMLAIEPENAQAKGGLEYSQEQMKLKPAYDDGLQKFNSRQFDLALSAFEWVRDNSGSMPYKQVATYIAETQKALAARDNPPTGTAVNTGPLGTGESGDPSSVRGLNAANQAHTAGGVISNVVAGNTGAGTGAISGGSTPIIPNSSVGAGTNSTPVYNQGQGYGGNLGGGGGGGNLSGGNLGGGGGFNQGVAVVPPKRGANIWVIVAITVAALLLLCFIGLVIVGLSQQNNNNTYTGSTNGSNVAAIVVATNTSEPPPMDTAASDTSTPLSEGPTSTVTSYDYPTSTVTGNDNSAPTPDPTFDSTFRVPSTPTPGQDDSTGSNVSFSTYTSPTGYFSIDYPGGWRYNEGNGTVTFFEPNVDAFLTVEVGSRTYALTNQQLEAEELNQLNILFNSPVTMDSGSLDTSTPWVALTFTGTYNNEAYRGISNIKQTGSILYMVMSATKTSVGTAYSAILKQMGQSYNELTH